MYAHEQLCYPKFFLVMVTQAALWAMIVTDRFCATRKKKKGEIVAGEHRNLLA